MKNALVSFQGNKQIQTEITLTGSKSECNRALIISALSKGSVAVENMSNAADTVTLNRILNDLSQDNQHQQTVDVGPAGTGIKKRGTGLVHEQLGRALQIGTQRIEDRT